DWIWHSALPIAAYAGLLVGALSLARHTGGALFLMAAANMLMLFIGIHNAWDTVTYITIEQIRPES
ncbi:MAG TPA: hypothetical protein VIG47_14540, partial [Gemmatimonadaceae bacterium]